MSRISDDDERFWNLIICKCYATNKEMDAIGPFLCVAGIVLFLFVVFMTCSFNPKKTPPTPKAETEEVAK